MSFEMMIRDIHVAATSEIETERNSKWIFDLTLPTGEEKRFFFAGGRFVGSGLGHLGAAQADILMVIPQECDATPEERHVMSEAIRIWNH